MFLIRCMEESLIKAAAKGDVSAFKHIFDVYLPKMRPVCKTYVKNDPEVDDVLQEAFIKIYKNLNKYAFKGSFEGWVRRIVINTSLSYCKKKSKLPYFEDVETLQSHEADDDTSVIEEAEVSHIMNAIEQLPDGYKMVFNMYVVEDYSHKTIAELLDISEGTSRSQYAKAKKMIKKILDRQRDTPRDTLYNKQDKN